MFGISHANPPADAAQRKEASGHRSNENRSAPVGA